jgi:hypothetical protein
VSGIFDKITNEAIKHGTAGFFRGLLGIAAALLFLAYTDGISPSVRWLVEYGLVGFLFVSLAYTAYSMTSKGKPKVEEMEPLPPPSLPDLSDNVGEDFARRIREWREPNRTK